MFANSFCQLCWHNENFVGRIENKVDKMRTKSWQNENFVGRLENKVGRMRTKSWQNRE